MRVLLVDPSGRGGIVRYTRLVAKALRDVGADPVVLASRAIGEPANGYEVRQWLPKQRWGRPEGAYSQPGFYASQALAWLLAAAAVELAVRRDCPDLVHFQAPMNRRLDATLLRHIRRHVPVVWTAHDVVPPEPAAGDERRFASIYRSADLVLVHSETAADAVRRLAQVEPLIIEHVPSDIVPVDRVAARRRLGLPEGERILGALGFVRQYKGYDLLADVWERLALNAPLLLLMGEAVGDDGRRVLERLARSERTILRAGYASDEDLRLAVSAVDALLLPYVSASESGLLRLAQAVRLPILASDAPQLAAAVRAIGGAVLGRDVDRWAEAVNGRLPSPPSPPHTLEAVGVAHLEAYAEARRRARARDTPPTRS
jgi:glycosyltransferase involved in cell wall biosynthesis